MTTSPFHRPSRLVAALAAVLPAVLSAAAAAAEPLPLPAVAWAPRSYVCCRADRRLRRRREPHRESVAETPVLRSSRCSCGCGFRW